MSGMRTPNVFIAYTPRGAGLRCAIAYLPAEHDAYGWFTGPRLDLKVASCFFLLEDLYTSRPTRYEAVDHAELHSAWSLGEARRHELAQMQEMFAREWLVYPEDPRAATEHRAYADAELAMGEVGVRFERLARFSRQQATWTFYSPGFERTVLRHLAKRWPLEYEHGSEPAQGAAGSGSRAGAAARKE
jgi:hypothetical protein